MRCLFFSMGGYEFCGNIEDVREIGKKKNAKIVAKEKGFLIINYREKSYVIIDTPDIFRINEDGENILFLTDYEDIGLTIGKIKGIFDVTLKNIPKSIFDVEYISKCLWRDRREHCFYTGH